MPARPEAPARIPPRLRFTSAGADHDALRPRISRFFPGLLVLLFLAGCSSGDGDDPTAGGTGRDGRPAAGAASAVNVLAAEVQAMSPQAPPFPEDVKAAVTARLAAYLDTAVVAPLERGTPPAEGLGELFTDAALARVSAPGPDRAALVEEGTPVKGRVRQDRANARLTALAAPGGEVVLVTAQVDVAHVVEAAGRSVVVMRSGELVLVPFGGWRIDAFDIRTARDTQPEGD